MTWPWMPAGSLSLSARVASCLHSPLLQTLTHPAIQEVQAGSAMEKTVGTAQLHARSDFHRPEWTCSQAISSSGLLTLLQDMSYGSNFVSSSIPTAIGPYRIDKNYLWDAHFKYFVQAYWVSCFF